MLLHRATVRVPPHAEVERLAIRRAIPELSHGLAGPVLFAEVVPIAEEAPRRPDEVREPLRRPVEVLRVAEELVRPRQRQRGLAGEVEELHVDADARPA